MNLFESAAAKNTHDAPLAERMRPRALDDVVGQEHLLDPGKPLRRLVEHGDIPSLLLWGPPGSGKTTLARMLAHYLEATFETQSAVMGGVKELREVVERARERRTYHGKRTVLFVDEIHRFNKAQQDALLPHVESGLLTLIGATTENPSFEVNAALLSRLRVMVLEALSEAALHTVLERALADQAHGLGTWGLTAEPEALAMMARQAQGDARRALGMLELCAKLAREREGAGITAEDVRAAATEHEPLLYDRAGEEHYNVVSAFIKSMRGSDPDAAVYWLVRMLEAGEPPRFILRRMVIFASEDVGNADPQALMIATSALQAFELVGLPEGVLPMTQAAAYLACAPKSNAVIAGYGAARAAVRQYGALPVPKHLRNAATGLMQAQGYGKGYKYPHNFEGSYVVERYLPDALAGQVYYRPSGNGHERDIAARLADWRALGRRDTDE